MRGSAIINTLTAAFDGNTSIKSATLQLDVSYETAAVAGICQSMKGLLGLTNITLDFDRDAPIGHEDAVSMSKVFQVNSLRCLTMEQMVFADDEASLTFSQAIAQSTLTELKVSVSLRIDHRGHEEWKQLDMTGALTGSRLQVLDLVHATLLDLEEAKAFCRALAGSQLRVLKLTGIQLHADFKSALGKSMCRPCLEHLEVYSSSDTISESIATNLNSAAKLQVLKISIQSPFTSDVVAAHVLGGCSKHCPDLLELNFFGIRYWTVALDKAAAECTRTCSKLVKIGLQCLPFGDIDTSPAFLAACQVHRVVEEITPPTDCPQLRTALDLVTTRNKETRIHRSRFESLAADRHGRAAFCRDVAQVNNKPHLIFLALTSNKHLFSG